MLGVLEIQVPRELGLYGPQEEEVTGGRRTLYNEKLHDSKS